MDKRTDQRTKGLQVRRKDTHFYRVVAQKLKRQTEVKIEMNIERKRKNGNERIKINKAGYTA